jgi:restriction system protein
MGNPLLGALFIALAVMWFNHYDRKLKKREYQEFEAILRSLELDDVDTMDDFYFKHCVCRLLRDRGYDAEVTKASGDFVVDILANREGQSIAVQTIRQSKNVSRRALSDACAGMASYGCTATMVVTNAYFSKGAYELAESVGCELIDRETLAQWVRAYQQTDNSKQSA